MRRCALAGSVLAALAAPQTVSAQAAPAQTAPGKSAFALGRQLTGWLLSGDTGALYPLLDDRMRATVHGDTGLAAFTRQIRAQLGSELRLVREDTTLAGGQTSYVRIAQFAKSAGAAVEVRFAWDARGRVTGMRVGSANELAPTRFLDYQTRTALRLPFDSDWFVFWGGRSLKQNYHAAYIDQRFAYDFLVQRDRHSHTGTGKTNTDYFCFGKPVLAPADGIVVVAVDSIADNVPGVMNATQPPGNYVVIDHGNREYSLLAHMRRGSVRVRPGQRLKAGDQIGECGNSGNSSEPHLHYHLQDGPLFGRAQGLPAYFVEYLADGTRVARGEPVQGQTIAQR